MNAAEHKALPFSANQTGPGAKSAPGADAAHAGHTKKRPAANAAGRGDCQQSGKFTALERKGVRGTAPAGAFRSATAEGGS